MATAANKIAPRYGYTKISASTAVKASAGTLHRLLVSASGSGVITVYDNATAASGTKIIDALSVAAKDNFEINAWTVNGIYVNIDSGTATITVLYN